MKISTAISEFATQAKSRDHSAESLLRRLIALKYQRLFPYHPCNKRVADRKEAGHD